VSHPSSRSPQPTPASGATSQPVRAPIASAAEGEQLVSRLCGTMDALLGVLDEESALVRAGRLRAASSVAPGKSDLARAYFADAEILKANVAFLSAHVRRPFEQLRARHEAFRARLQTNLTVLATAHAVSEGLIRGVAGEMARKSSPQTYGHSGRANTPGRNSAQPIAISRTL
jgi:hypothetical protein